MLGYSLCFMKFNYFNSGFLNFNNFISANSALLKAQSMQPFCYSSILFYCRMELAALSSSHPAVLESSPNAALLISCLSCLSSFWIHSNKLLFKSLVWWMKEGKKLRQEMRRNGTELRLQWVMKPEWSVIQCGMNDCCWSWSQREIN